jgi:hypothetical protein
MKHAAALVISLVLLFLASSLFGLENPTSPNAEILSVKSVTLPFLNQVDQAAPLKLQCPASVPAPDFKIDMQGCSSECGGCYACRQWGGTIGGVRVCIDCECC